MTCRGIIFQEPEQMCEMCGKIDECRPYGPNDEQVCFDCAMKDEETTTIKMQAYIFGKEDDKS